MHTRGLDEAWPLLGRAETWVERDTCVQESSAGCRSCRQALHCLIAKISGRCLRRMSESEWELSLAQRRVQFRWKPSALHPGCLFS